MPIEYNIVCHPLALEKSLLRVESVLGLSRPDTPLIEMLLRYGLAIDEAGISRFTGSLAADRLATIHHCLKRREELLLSGWDGVLNTGPLLQEIAAIETSLGVTAASCLWTHADRLRSVLRLLQQGLTLPVPLMYTGEVTLYPLLWRQLFQVCRAQEHSVEVTEKIVNHALSNVQRALHDETRSIELDETLSFVCGATEQGVAQALVSMLSGASPEQRAATTLVCNNATFLSAVNDRLVSKGLPQIGTDPMGAYTALDGLLPMVLALCWDPVDPALLLEFCVLPNGPLGHRVGNELANSLSVFPGLNSTSWLQAIEELTDEDRDSDGSIAHKLHVWFDQERTPRGQLIPSLFLAERCTVIAQWATTRAGTAEVADRAPFQNLANTAAYFADILTECNEDMSAQMLDRLSRRVLHGSAVTRHQAEAGAPFVCAQPWEIPADAENVIWIDPLVTEPANSNWSGAEKKELSSHDITLEHEWNVVVAQHNQDLLGLQRIQQSLVVIEFPDQADKRLHQAISMMKNCLAEGALPNASACLDTSMTAEILEVGKWQVHYAGNAIEEPQSQRATWVPPGLGFQEREQHSYSELEKRIACPLAWTLDYAARINDRGAAALPAEHQLKGTFAHAVLENVFSESAYPPERAAERAEEVFDERIQTDAVLFMSPGKTAEREKFKKCVVESARVLAGVYRETGSRQMTMESRFKQDVDGWPLSGSIDCLLTCDDSAIIIDIKLGSKAKRAEQLAQKKSIQLAIYASTRSEQRVSVAYYIINNKCLLISNEHAPPGIKDDDPSYERIEGAGSWRETWDQLKRALDEDTAWMNGEHIPARPLQLAEEWPESSTLVLDAEDPQSACEYCEYHLLCGMRECH